MKKLCVKLVIYKAASEIFLILRRVNDVCQLRTFSIHNATVQVTK